MVSGYKQSVQITGQKRSRSDHLKNGSQDHLFPVQ